MPLAIVFDVLDGRIARWRHRASPLGRELDSLADLISFGVAPASIAYAVGLDTVLDQCVLVYFVLCGLSRLARYNVTAESLSDSQGKVRHFEGTPIPTSVLLVLLLLALTAAGRIGDALPFDSPLDTGRRRSPFRPGVRALRIADDQQDAPHPETLSRLRPRRAAAALVRRRDPLERRKLARPRAERKGRVDPGELGVASAGGLRPPRSRRRARAWSALGIVKTEGRRTRKRERDLARGGAVRGGDLLEHASAPVVRGPGKRPCPNGL